MGWQWYSVCVTSRISAWRANAKLTLQKSNEWRDKYLFHIALAMTLRGHSRSLIMLRGNANEAQMGGGSLFLPW